MKPHNLISAEGNGHLDNQYKLDLVAKNEDGSLIGKVLTSIAVAVVIFSFFAMTPYFRSLFHTMKTETVISQPTQPKLSPTTHLDAYLWTAKLKLEDLKLNHRLAISLTDAGSLKVGGSISKQEATAWNNFQKWYENKDGFPKFVHAVDVTATSGDIPELKSVWFDASPTAYFTDGRVGNIGTVLNDGWKIVSIEAWAVFVERNGTTITLSY